MQGHLSLQRKLWHFSCVALLVFGTLLVPHSLSAQSTALLTGTVVDPSGAVVPETQVKCRNTQTGLTYTATTTSDGIFRFPNLPIGSYDLTVNSAGFERLVRSGITLLTGQSVDVHLQLQVGSASQTVRVNAPVPVVQPTASVVQTTITSASERNLPLNGRNAMQLVALVPGTINNGGATGSYHGENISFAVNGNRGTDNSYTLDGVSYVDPGYNIAPTLPSPDSLEEFTVKTSNFDASQQGSGANIQFSLRSGTNQWHGSAFEFIRNNVLDARNYFQTTANAQFKRNQFGGTFGGPIIKNKTFFFGAYQGSRTRGGASPAIMIIPSAVVRNGDFSSTGKTIIDPLTKLPFPNDTIPSNRFSAINQKLLATIPIPSQATGIARVPTKPKTDMDDTQFSIKIDHNLTARDHLSGHWFYDTNSAQTQTTALPDYGSNLKYHSHSIMGSETHTFSPHLIFVGTYGITLIPREATPETSVTMQSLGANVPYAQPGGPMINVAISGYASPVTSAAISPFHTSVQQFRAAFTWERSKHLVQFGMDVTRTTQYSVNNNAAGNWTYNGSLTSSPTVKGSGDAFADFLLGLPQQFYQQGSSPQNVVGTLWAPWIQDDWKALPNFTVNMGLRWDPDTPPVDRFGPQTGWEPGVQSVIAPGAPLGVVFSGDPGVPRAVIHNDWKSFAPRVGFAWDVAGDSKTIVRGAYGIFYRPQELMNITRFSSNSAAGRGLLVTVSPAASAEDPYANYAPGDPFPAWKPAVTAQQLKTFVFPNPVATAAFAPGIRSSYVQEWNMTVERQLAPSLAVSLAYVGNHMVKGISSTEGNVAKYGPGATQANSDSRRPYKGLASLQLVSGFEFSNYNALQLVVTKRATRGLNLLANYTYAKCMDNNSATTGNVTVINKLDPNKDYARCDFDLTQVANVSFVYSLPSVPYFRGIVDKALNHWMVTSIFGVQSGGVFSVSSGVQNSLSGPTTNSGITDLADQIAPNTRPAGVSKIAEYFNTKAYVPNALGTFGDSGRNSLTGPGSFSWDFGLMKVIPITKRLQTEFRFEAFNFPNHTNFGNPVATQNNALFGKITSAGDPRVIQFALKLSF